MKKIIRNEQGDIFIANVVSELPNGLEDVTDMIVNPEKTDEVTMNHLAIQIIPAIEEVQAQAAFWSNGVDTVYESNDIPTVEDENGNAILDPAYVKTNVIVYVAPEPQKFLLVKKSGADQAIATEVVQEIVKKAIQFGSDLLVQFSTENVIMGITQDGKTKQVRQAMAEIITALQTGSLYDAIDEIDLIPQESKDDKYITNARLQEYKVKIQQYLGIV